MHSIRSRVPAPPNRCGRFPPSKRELHEGSLLWCRVRDCSGSRPRPSARSKLRPALRAERTRVPGMKPRCPGPSRRTRHVLVPSATNRTRGLPLTRRLLCLLSYEGDKVPLRLCPNASIPSDVVSRCTWPGQGSRTSRTANTMSRGNGVKGHTRSGADDESRTRGLDHGVVALCLLSYIRKKCKTGHRPVPRSSCGKLLESIHRRSTASAVRSIDRWSALIRRPVKVRKQKGPDPFGIRASAYRYSRVRVYARLPPGCTWSSFRSSH